MIRLIDLKMYTNRLALPISETFNTDEKWFALGPLEDEAMFSLSDVFGIFKLDLKTDRTKTIEFLEKANKYSITDRGQCVYFANERSHQTNRSLDIDLFKLDILSGNQEKLLLLTISNLPIEESKIELIALDHEHVVLSILIDDEYHFPEDTPEWAGILIAHQEKKMYPINPTKMGSINCLEGDVWKVLTKEMGEQLIIEFQGPNESLTWTYISPNEFVDRVKNHLDGTPLIDCDDVACANIQVQFDEALVQKIRISRLKYKNEIAYSDLEMFQQKAMSDRKDLIFNKSIVFQNACYGVFQLYDEKKQQLHPTRKQVRDLTTMKLILQTDAEVLGVIEQGVLLQEVNGNYVYIDLMDFKTAQRLDRVVFKLHRWVSFDEEFGIVYLIR